MKNSLRRIQNCCVSYGLHRVSLASFARTVGRVKPKLESTLEQEQSQATSQVSKNKSDSKRFRNEVKRSLDEEDRAAPFEELKQEGDATEEAHVHFLQRELEIPPTLDALLKAYDRSHAEYNLIHYCTFLNQAVKIALKAKISNLSQRPQIEETIEHLKKNIEALNEFSLANFLFNLGRLSYKDIEIVDKAIEIILRRKDRGLVNETSATFILSALAKFNNKHTEMIKFLCDYLKQQTDFKVLNVPNIFWAMNKLKIKDSELLKKLEKFIIAKTMHFKPVAITTMFTAYSQNIAPNYDVLDALSYQIIRNPQDYSFRALSNILVTTSKLNYLNHNLLSIIEAQMTRRLKDRLIKETGFNPFLDDNPTQEDGHKLQTPKKDEEGFNQENSVEDGKEIAEFKPENLVINHIDIAQIMTCYAKLKIFKPTLFKALETIFLSMIQEASPASITAFTYAHSAFAVDLILNFRGGKEKYLRRSVKNLRQFNDTFYEVMLPIIQIKLKDFKLEEVFSILVSANKPRIKKRALCRQLLEIATESLPKLEMAKNRLDPKGYSVFVYNYYKAVENFLLGEQQGIDFRLALSQATKLNIDELNTSHSYLLPEARRENDIDI